MRWTELQEQAILKSIKYWTRDIIKPLALNLSPSPKAHNEEKCAMCGLAHIEKILKGKPSNSDCNYCPYEMFYGISCDHGGSIKGHWFHYSDKKTLKNACRMRLALQMLLK